MSVCLLRRGRGGNSLANCLEYLLFQLCPLFINMAGSAAILASHFGPSVIAIIGTTAVAYLATLQVSMGRHAALRAEYVDRTDNTSAIKNESINNVELLKYFGMEPYEVNRYSKALLHTQKADWDLDIYAYTVQLIQDNVQVIGRSRGHRPVRSWLADTHLQRHCCWSDSYCAFSLQWRIRGRSLRDVPYVRWQHTQQS